MERVPYNTIAYRKLATGEIKTYQQVRYYNRRAMLAPTVVAEIKQKHTEGVTGKRLMSDYNLSRYRLNQIIATWHG